MSFRGSYGGFGFGVGLTPWVKRLMIANAAVFVLTFIAPMLGDWLAFAPGRMLLRPWTIATYMFVHGGVLHLLFNMLGLFFFGPPLESQWGSREFLKYYVICGIGGAVFSFLFAPSGSVVGASAAVFGVMLAFAMNWPDSPIYFWGIFPIKAKWLVAILAGLALFSAIGGSGSGVAHFAHLGGFAFGFFYLRFQDPISSRLARMKKTMPRRRLSVVPGASPSPAPRPAESRRPRRRDEEKLLDEVDRVLDKISTSGLSSLSADERRLLDDVSRRYRQN